MKRLLFDCGTRDTTASIGILALRVMTGLMMLIGHGIVKIRHFDAVLEKFPAPDFFPFHYLSKSASLWMCISAEVGASALIILGLATRPAAFILGFTMVVAAFDTHGQSPWFFAPGLLYYKELALLYLIPMMAIILTGAGQLSLDGMLHQERKSRFKMSF